MGLMPGMTVVGVFNRRFDADLAVAMLDSAGIEAVIVSDTNPETGNVNLSASGFKVAVRDEISEDAIDLLAAEPYEDVAHDRRFADRSRLVRWGTYAVLAAMAGPVIVMALIEAEWLVDALFP